MALEDGGAYPPGYPGTGSAHHHRRAYVVPAVAVTVVGLVAIGIGEDIPTRHSIEHKLTDASEAALDQSGVPYLSVSFTGRDGTVTVDGSEYGASLTAHAQSVVEGVSGVRTVRVLMQYHAESPPVTASPSPTVSLTIEPSPGLPSASAFPSAGPSETLAPSASAAPPVEPSSPAPIASPAPSGSGGQVAPGGATASQVQQELNVLGEITFAPGSAKLTARDNTIVAKVAAILKANPDVRIRVQGDTDSIGPAAFNLTMSRRRATAVADALVAQGVSRDRLSIVGYGETKPLAPNTSPANRAMNRRVDFTTY